MIILAVAVAAIALTGSAPDELGISGLRFGMSKADVQARAPMIAPVVKQGAFYIHTDWALAGSVTLESECEYKVEVGGNKFGMSDMALRLSKGDVSTCARAAVGRMQAHYGLPRVQQNGAPAVPSSYYIWGDGQRVLIEVSHFYGGNGLTYLCLSAVDSLRSPSVVQ